MRWLLSISPFTPRPGVSSKVSALIVMNVLLSVRVNAELIEGLETMAASLQGSAGKEPLNRDPKQKLKGRV